MPAPSVSITTQDGKLGLISQSGDPHLKIGVSSLGTQNLIYSFTDPKDAVSALGSGPLVEAIASALAEGATPVYAIRANSSVAGVAGAVTFTGTGASAATIAGAPLDTYDVILKITRAGASLAAATAAFVYSLDGGDTYSPETAIPVSGIFILPGTGLTITFGAGTFVAGDIYSFTATAPGMTLADLQTAFAAALADPREWRFAHVIGNGSATIAAGVQSILLGATSDHRYSHAWIEWRGKNAGETQAQYDAAFATEWASFAGDRIMVIPEELELVSPLTARVNRTNPARVLSGRRARRPISEDLGRVKTGPVAGITKLYRDERAQPGLDALRAATMRTHVKKAGFYPTQGPMMSTQGSDIKYVQYREVLDRACSVTYQSLVELLNEQVPVDPVTGFILETAALGFEAEIGGKLRAAIVEQSHAQDVLVVIRRDINLLSTQRIEVDVAVLPFGYAKYIVARVGFRNPALEPKVPAPAAGQTATAPAASAKK